MFKFKQYVEDVENFELDEDEQSEATKTLSFATRAKMKRNAIKNRNKLKLGAKRQKKKIASLSRLKKRARRTVRRAFAKKLAGGKKISSVGQKNILMKRLGGKVMQNRMVRKSVPQLKKTRQADKQRKQGGAGRTGTG
jgi:hypothetical protein